MLIFHYQIIKLLLNMKKTLIYQPKLTLHLPFRWLLLLLTVAMLSVDVLAQDTATARIPRVKLVPVNQREAMNNYINKIWTSSGWRLEVFDGKNESTLTFDRQALIEISSNHRYFTIAKPVNNPIGSGGRRIAYEVELRDVSNATLAKVRLSSLGSEEEEGHDEFMPSDDGLGIIHKANPALSGGLRFAFIQREGSMLIKRFEVDKTAFGNALVIHEPAQEMIVATFEGHMPDSKVSQTYMQCYSSNGTLQWETPIDSQHVKSPLFISAFDGTITFVTLNQQDRSNKNLFLFGKNGKMIRQLPVYRGGVYKRSYFHTVNGRQYFLGPSDGEYYYVMDLTSGEIINRNTQSKEGAYVTGLAMHQQFIITSYFNGGYRPGPKIPKSSPLRNTD